MANDCIPFYEPADDLPCHASAAVTGKRLVKISGSRQSGPGLSNSSEGSNYQVAHADAGGRALGVAAYDAALGEKVAIKRSGVFPVLAAAAIDAFEEVEVGTNGRVIPLAAGTPVGVALTAAANGADAEILLYQ